MEEETYGFSQGPWVVDGASQKQLWKIAMAMGVIKFVLPGFSGYTKDPAYIQACVSLPFVLLVGDVQIKFQKEMFNVNCKNCYLQNCVDSSILKGEAVMIVHQPSFVMLPVNVTQSHAEYETALILQTIEKALIRRKRVIGLIIAGIAALIALIASTVTAAVALSESIQTASYVNSLSKNVSLSLGYQEDIDMKLESRLEALHKTVMWIGDEIQGVKTRLQIQCHPAYKWICVTKKTFNTSDWDRVQKHLSGVWNHANISLDLLGLHKEILDITSAPPISLDLAKTVQEFYKSIKAQLPNFPNLWHLAATVGLLLLVLILLCAVLPTLVKCGLQSLMNIKAEILKLQLKTTTPSEKSAANDG